jgi:hypothetical protein
VLPGSVGMAVGCCQQHSTQASLPRHFFVDGGLAKRTNSSFPRALLLAAELHGATGPSCDPNIRCSRPPRACFSCRNAQPAPPQLTQMPQAMTIYDLAHPAVNSTAPCWQGEYLMHMRAGVGDGSRAALCSLLASVGRPKADQITSSQYSKRVPAHTKHAVEAAPDSKCEVDPLQPRHVQRLPRLSHA